MLTRLKRFVSQRTSKLCNQFFYLPIFSTPCMSHLLYLMFRCDFDVMESLEELEGSEHSPQVFPGQIRRGWIFWLQQALLLHQVYPSLLLRMDFGSDTDKIIPKCHILPHFNPNTNGNTVLLGYKYRTDSLNSDSDADTLSI